MAVFSHEMVRDFQQLFEIVGYTDTQDNGEILGVSYLGTDEGKEPPHIHVEYGESECKFWLSPIVLARNKGIKPPKLREVEKLIFKHNKFLLEKYYEFHNK